jgi:hypothetical protein
MSTNESAFSRRQFYLPPDMVSFLREAAYSRRVSQAWIIREAVRAWAKKNADIKLEPEPKPE